MGQFCNNPDDEDATAVTSFSSANISSPTTISTATRSSAINAGTSNTTDTTGRNRSPQSIGRRPSEKHKGESDNTSSFNNLMQLMIMQRQNESEQRRDEMRMMQQQQNMMMNMMIMSTMENRFGNVGAARSTIFSMNGMMPNVPTTNTVSTYTQEDDSDDEKIHYVIKI